MPAHNNSFFSYWLEHRFDHINVDSTVYISNPKEEVKTNTEFAKFYSEIKMSFICKRMRTNEEKLMLATILYNTQICLKSEENQQNDKQ